METTIPVDNLIDDYITWARDRAHLQPATIKVYDECLRHFDTWLRHEGLTLSDVRPMHVENFGNRQRRHGGPPAASTARREIVTIRMFFEWLQMNDHEVRSMKLAKAPKVNDEDPKPIDDDVWLPVWRADLEPQDRLFLGLGYYLGLRRIEIVTAPPTAVHATAGYMRFVRKGGSTHPIEYSEMVGVISDELPHLAPKVDEFLDILHDTATFRAERNYPTLWWDTSDVVHLDANRLNKRLSRILSGLGMDEEAFTPHALRHSCATNLLRAGVEPVLIRNLLNHVSLTTTMRYMKTSGQLGQWRRRRTTR